MGSRPILRSSTQKKHHGGTVDPTIGSSEMLRIRSKTKAEPEVHARRQRLVLDKAYRYLVDQGSGTLELASLDLEESSAMARQLATELNLTYGDWLAEAVYCWMQEAREEAKIFQRARGYYSGDLAWMSLMPPVEVHATTGVGLEPAYAPELPPPKGNQGWLQR
ncbi:unnamed protein product [Symbiodinium microadriaticum]|nr:unnamed protein product [Symbiodinium microadriaticum]